MVYYTVKRSRHIREYNTGLIKGTRGLRLFTREGLIILQTKLQKVIEMHTCNVK